MMDMVKDNDFITALRKVHIDIEGEICEATKGMYLAITRVDLDSGEAVVLHGDRNDTIGNTYPWDDSVKLLWVFYLTGTCWQ